MNDIPDDFIEEAAPKGSLPARKKAFSWFSLRILAGAFAVLVLAVLAGTGAARRPNDTLAVNPVTKCETMQAAQEITGFSLNISGMTPEDGSIAVYGGKMIEVTCTTPSGTVRVRKAEGSDDISGDYNTYEIVDSVTAGQREVTVKGTDGGYELATWTDNGFTYSLQNSEGMTKEAVIEIISGIE